MIIWRGWGWLVGILILAMPALVQLAVDKFIGSGIYKLYSRPLFAGALIIVAIIVWFLGRYLNQRDSPMARSNFQTAHSFMLLRMEYWAILLGCGAVAMLVL
ncbi:hypothetical protein [Herpetosiphon llansteffanensis]|uniref:hypothetical protein n=1 Tax=Herpetosiphon llansteffanensis TaxID=2094568 RepID=UPI000D7D1616|nr:hypothetical protein [Herpetosiphon llansteffanensis]